MAGDWIKMRQDLRDDPAVVQIAILTDIDEDTVVGKLHRLWSWADKHTTDGAAPAITKNWVDRYVAQSGFADAMASAGWISFSESGILFPSFDIHNGNSAKSRAEASVRQRLSRKNRDDGVTGVEKTAIPKPFVRHVLNRDNYTCVYCGTESDEATENSRKARLSIDHIIPETRGGSASVANLACCCRKCNNEKNDRTPEEWGLEPAFLQDGVTYKDGQMSQKNRDMPVTKSLPEKRREEKSINTEANASVVRATKKCPSSFEVTADLMDWATEKCPLVAQATETATFRDYTFSRAIGDWVGAWRNWMRKAQKDAEAGQTKRGNVSSHKTFAQQDREAGWARWEAQTNRVHPDRIASQGVVIDASQNYLEISQ